MQGSSAYIQLRDMRRRKTNRVILFGLLLTLLAGCTNQPPFVNNGNPGQIKAIEFYDQQSIQPADKNPREQDHHAIAAKHNSQRGGGLPIVHDTIEQDNLSEHIHDSDEDEQDDRNGDRGFRGHIYFAFSICR